MLATTWVSNIGTRTVPEPDAVSLADDDLIALNQGVRALAALAHGLPLPRAVELADALTDESRGRALSDEPQFRMSREVLTVMGGLMLGMLLASLNMTLVAPALPRIVAELGGIN